jgi:phospholipid/cholesterol/gamma-HCH transport system substrate-binding protein
MFSRFSRILSRLEQANPRRIGATTLILVLVLGVALFQKQKLETIFSPGGEQVRAIFASDYRLRPYITKVKVAGVPVGVVTGVDQTSHGQALVTMKVDGGTRDKLGSEPSAAIRPATLLGGNYYLDLRPGGDPTPFSGTIPVSRTTVPIELDSVLSALQPDIRTSMRGTIDKVGQTLNATTQADLRQLVAEAPTSLQEMTPVLTSLEGTQPSVDLTRLVTGLEATARGMTQTDGALKQALTGLGSLGSALGNSGPALRTAVGYLPGALETARTGLAALDHSLAEVRSVSQTSRPTVQALNAALGNLEPALAATRPLMANLVPTLQDLNPVVQDLLPTSQTAVGVLADVNGGPLQRLNGPIMHTLLAPWRGGAGTLYAGDGNSTPFYQELGYMAAGGSASATMTDRNGATLHFQPGLGFGTISGLPISLERLLLPELRPYERTKR